MSSSIWKAILDYMRKEKKKERKGKGEIEGWGQKTKRRKGEVEIRRIPNKTWAK